MQASRVYYALAALLLCLASAAPLAAAQAASASPAAAASPAAMPGMQHGMAGMPGMQHGMAGMAADDSMPKPPCVANPQAANCSAFKLPHDTVVADGASLCRAMSFMAGCTLRAACRAAAPNASAVTGPWTAKVAGDPDVCRAFQVLATVCTHDEGMGKMAGCRANFNSMCAAGSVVPQCKDYPGYKQLPTTKAANAAVKALCTAKRTRPGCADCLASFDANKTYGSCDLLAVWGEICVAEPKAPECASHAALCAKEKGWFFCRAGAVDMAAAGTKLLAAEGDHHEDDGHDHGAPAAKAASAAVAASTPALSAVAAGALAAWWWVLAA